MRCHLKRGRAQPVHEPGWRGADSHLEYSVCCRAVEAEGVLKKVSSGRMGVEVSRRHHRQGLFKKEDFPES